jgi:cysteine-rich CPXCG protein
MKKKRPGRTPRPASEASYVCDACGETIVIPIDLSAGESQEYVEDCPVCCRPNVIHVELDEGAEPRVWAEGE